MSFIWPQALVLVLLVPLGVLAYRAIDRRRRRRIASFGRPVEDPVAHPRTPLRRLVGPALILAGMTVLTVAMARPQGVVDVPRQVGTVILAFDVSGSMAATDLTPTRMAAAKAAAKDFVERQPSSVVIGVVAFSDSGATVQQPTNDQATVLAAIDRLTVSKGTSVGSGILASLDAIAVADAGPNVDYYSNRSPAPSPSPTPVPAGTHAPAVIVLLTDGENNESPDPLAAAQQAADRGVRVYTVGIGSAAGTTLDLNGFQVHTQLDAATLQQIAQTTDGTYYSAADTASLRSIYSNLDTHLVVKPEAIELTPLFAGASLLILVAGALSSLVWLGRAP
jgi:Ca-activated chloride channel family protein